MVLRFDVLLLLWVFTGSALAAEEQAAWDLRPLYESEAAWAKAVKDSPSLVIPVENCQNHWTDTPQRLGACLEAYFRARKEVARIMAYASHKVSVRGDDAEAQAQKGQAEKLRARLNEASSPLESEVLSIPKAKFQRFLDEETVKPYARFVKDIVRLRDHILGAKENRLLALSMEMAAGPRDAHYKLSNLDMPRAKITLKSGETVELSAPAFTQYRQTADAEDRAKVFQAFFGGFRSFRETFASFFNTMVNRDRFYSKAQYYKSDLEAALKANNIPLRVYSRMIEEVKGHRHLLWRYLRLKKQVLGLKELRYSDLYMPLTNSKAPNYPYEEALKIAGEVLKPLGEEYLGILEQSNKERWVDVYPGKTKFSGAFMDGSAYDVHPYVLMNYTGNYESLSTYLHEFGHAAHSFLANKNQPYQDADYPIFVAEVASTFNENLLYHHLLDSAKDNAFRLFVLGQFLEGFRTTVFRQASFADFELQIHTHVERGGTLTADVLEETYLKILKEYYGDSEGVVKIEDLYGIEWAYVPHFFGNFYVFQYTTSFIASNALAEKVLAEGDKAREAYLSMLKAGGSLYPLELLKLGGVDMSGTGPYDNSFAAMEKALEEAEKIVLGLGK